MLLSGCIGEPIEVSGSGVITVSWQGTAERAADQTQPAPFSWGDTLLFCAPGLSVCDQTNWLYALLPPVLSTGVQVSAASQVQNRDFETVELPAGSYSMRVLNFRGSPGAPLYGSVGGVFQVEIAEPTARDLSIWHQSVGRPSADAACPSGFTRSWAEWPNNGSGGFVCNRMIYKYYPESPVYVAGTPNMSDWLVSIGRSDASADCPPDFQKSWAQWPNDGSGGFVCNHFGGGAITQSDASSAAGRHAPTGVLPP